MAERSGQEARAVALDSLDELARAWQEGNRAAFTDLVVETQAELRIHISAYCDSRELVEEILQETYVTCFHKIGQYQPRGTLLAWLKAIARHHLVDHWRERRRIAEIDAVVAERLVAAATLDALEVADEARERERWSAALARCLGQLQPRARELIRRRHLQSTPLAELARQFKQPMAALSVALHRIRRSLRRCLEGEA